MDRILLTMMENVETNCRVTFTGGSVSQFSLHMHFFKLKMVRPLVFQTNHPVFHIFFSKSGYFLAIYGHFEHFVFQIFSSCQQHWIESLSTPHAPALPAKLPAGRWRSAIIPKIFTNFTSLLKLHWLSRVSALKISRRLERQVVQLSFLEILTLVPDLNWKCASLTRSWINLLGSKFQELPWIQLIRNRKWTNLTGI